MSSGSLLNRATPSRIRPSGMNPMEQRARFVLDLDAGNADVILRTPSPPKSFSSSGDIASEKGSSNPVRKYLTTGTRSSCTDSPSTRPLRKMLATSASPSVIVKCAPPNAIELHTEAASSTD